MRRTGRNLLNVFGKESFNFFRFYRHTGYPQTFFKLLDAVVTGNTVGLPPIAVLPSFDQPRFPNKGTAHGNIISHLILNDFLSHRQRPYASHYDQGEIDGFFKGPGFLPEGGLLLFRIDFFIQEIGDIEKAAAYFQGVYFSFFEPDADLQGIFQGQSPFDPVPGIELNQQGKPSAFLFSNGLDRFQERPGPVLNRTAVSVGAGIITRAKELAEKKAVGGKDLHTVKPGIPGPGRGPAEGLDHLLNIAPGHSLHPAF